MRVKYYLSNKFVSHGHMVFQENKWYHLDLELDTFYGGCIDR